MPISAAVDPAYEIRVDTTLLPSAADHLRALEAESIHIMREVVAEFERPVMLYSIGKDSSVLLRLAQKAFHPGRIPFPLQASGEIRGSGKIFTRAFRNSRSLGTSFSN